MIDFWPLLLPVAAGSGWLLALKRPFKPKQPIHSPLSHEYVVGLNYLLNEQPDKAVDLFIRLLDVDDETVETHLALGSLFRRRGEVDRAIRIHQNLIARPQLSQPQRVEALMALGQDYLSAGVYDRAERIFKEVTQLGGEGEHSSLRFLLDIYQQEKAWEQALDVAKKIEEVSGESMHLEMGHYFCELAFDAMSRGLFDKAWYLAKKAFYLDKNSVRASLLCGEIETRQRRFRVALKYYKRVPYQDPDYISEVIPSIYECYQQMGALDNYISYLQEIMVHQPRASVIFALAEHLFHQQGLDKALDFATEQLSKNPSIKGLNQLISWHVDTSHGKVKDKLNILYKITSKLLENKPVYRCGVCGFGGKHLHWQCPSCRKWSTIKPIHGLEGD